MKRSTCIQLLILIFLFVTQANKIQAQDGLSDWGEYEDVKQEAIQRINQHRKGEVNIKVMLNDQEVATNATVSINQTRHDFLWGAVTTRSFPTGNATGGPNRTTRYQDYLKKYFNAAGFTVALKPKWRGTQREEDAEEVMDWLLENDFYVRGHALTWEGAGWLPQEHLDIYNDPDLLPEDKRKILLDSMSLHFIHCIRDQWGDDVDCWDVTNEPLDNNLLNDLYPEFDTHAYWFRLADSLRKAHGQEHVLLYENQYQVISGTSQAALEFRQEGFESVGRKAVYAETIDNHIADGAKVEGIGFQSRLRAQWPRITPDSIYSRLRYFERFNLPLQATEFELVDGGGQSFTEAERQILTEYMMVMYLSHPSVEGFWHWTFSDIQQGSSTDYALFNYDGTPKNNGIIWMDLMDNFFTTNENLTSNTIGETSALAYYGTYDLTVEADGKTYTGQFDVREGSNTSIVVNLEDNEVETTFEDKLVMANGDVVYDFETDGESEGWVVTVGSVSVAEGALTYEGGTNAYGGVRSSTDLNLDQRLYDQVIIVAQNESGHANWQLTNYDLDDPAANNGEPINFTMNTLEDGSTFSTYVLDLPFNADLTDNLIDRIGIRSLNAPIGDPFELNIESITLVYKFGTEWNFNDGAQDWVTNSANTALEPVTELGEIGVRLEWDDGVAVPKMRISDLSIDAASYPKIQVRVKNNMPVENFSNSNFSQSMRVVVVTTEGSEFIPFDHSGNDTEFKTYTVDLTTRFNGDPRPNYGGTVTAIEIQGIRDGNAGSIIVDNIRMVKDGFGGSLVVSNNNTVVLDTLSLEPGDVVVVESGSTLDIKGSIDNNGGTITIESGGSLITYAGESYTGTGVTFERTRTFEPGRYSMIGVPIASVNASELNSPWIYSYSEATNTWEDATSGTLVAGQGYAFAGEQAVSFTGVPNTGEISYTANVSGNGYHLVANPYAAAISAASFINAQTNITGTLYLWDDGGSNTSQRTSNDYIAVNASGLNNDDYTIGGGGNTFDGYLGSMQGFIVQVTDNTVVKFTEEMRVYDKNYDANFFRKSSEKVPYVKLRLSNTDEEVKVMTIGWDAYANDEEINPYFDSKVFNEASDFAIYTLKAGALLAIQGITEARESVDMGITTNLSGTHTLSLDNDEYPERSLYLQDLQNGNLIDLSQEAYHFNLEEGQHLGRFRLLSDQASTLSPGTDVREFYVSEGMLHLQQTEPNLFTVFSLTGQQLFTHQSEGSEIVDLRGKLSEGIYLITNGKSVTKFIMR